jgi:hypothetical protein
MWRAKTTQSRDFGLDAVREGPITGARRKPWGQACNLCDSQLGALELRFPQKVALAAFNSAVQRDGEQAVAADSQVSALLWKVPRANRSSA